MKTVFDAIYEIVMGGPRGDEDIDLALWGEIALLIWLVV